MRTLPGLPGRIEAIVIGASAGGVEALSALLPELPAGMPVTVFVVLHLPRERPSLLADIFRPKCAVPVIEASDKEPATPGTVYFAPPDYHLLIEPGACIALSVDEAVNHSRPSIDVLFESAADVYRDRLMGIVLTGANEDGSAGLAAVHRAGGITVAQDPASARCPVMPAAALERVGPAAFGLPLADIAVVLRSLRGSPGDRP